MTILYLTFFFFVLSSYHVSVCLPVRREHRVRRSYICSKAVKVRFSSGRQLDCSSINYIPLLSLTSCQDPAYHCRLRVLYGSFVPCLLNVAQPPGSSKRQTSTATSLVQILSLKPRLHCSSNPHSIHFHIQSTSASSNPTNGCESIWIDGHSHLRRIRPNAE